MTVERALDLVQGGSGASCLQVPPGSRAGRRWRRPPPGCGWTGGVGAVPRGWPEPSDWYHPAVDAVCELLMEGSDPAAALVRLGAVRAAYGATVTECVLDVTALWEAYASEAPTTEILTTVLGGWGEQNAAPLAADVWQDPMTGLATTGFLRGRLDELCRAGTSWRHVFVVVEAPRPVAPLIRARRAASLGRVSARGLPPGGDLDDARQDPGRRAGPPGRRQRRGGPAARGDGPARADPRRPTSPGLAGRGAPGAGLHPARRARPDGQLDATGTEPGYSGWCAGSARGRDSHPAAGRSCSTRSVDQGRRARAGHAVQRARGRLLRRPAPDHPRRRRRPAGRRGHARPRPRDLDFDAVGGLTLGADPVATAMLHAAAARGRALDAFVVRKEGKAHGLQRRIEGPDVAGRRVLAVEDTSTTGGSVLTAVEALREAGAEVVGGRRDRRPGHRRPAKRSRPQGLPYLAAYCAAELGLALTAPSAGPTTTAGPLRSRDWSPTSGAPVVPLIIVIVVLVLVLLYGVLQYNGLIRLRNVVQESWRQIDVELKRRHDLIPNLVETVKGYAAHERETLEAVIAARTAAVAPGSSVAQQAVQENVLTQALGRLFAVAEAYPNLKANENFLALHAAACVRKLREAAAPHSVSREPVHRARARPKPVRHVLAERERSRLSVRGNHRAHELRACIDVRGTPHRLSLQVPPRRFGIILHEQ